MNSMDLKLTFDIESTSQKPTSLILNLLDKYGYKAIFFVPAKILESNPKIFLSIRNRGHEIGLHGFEHERFDTLTKKQKQYLLKKSVKIYKKIFKVNPRYFRAPQFSSDIELLNLLENFGFKYDSSTVQFPISQMIFFPSKIPLYIKQHKFNSYLKKQNMSLREVPVSSCILPISLFSLRILPLFIFKILVKLSSISRKDKKIVFLAHSYEFKNQKAINKFESFLKTWKRK